VKREESVPLLKVDEVKKEPWWRPELAKTKAKLKAVEKEEADEGECLNSPPH
jgi:hypothetical protein